MYFRAKFPDIGAGRTRLHCYVEGDSEAEVRELAATHPHFCQWDASKGTVTRTNLTTRESLENRLTNATHPNAAVLRDGTVLRRSSDVNGIIEQTPN